MMIENFGQKTAYTTLGILGTALANLVETLTIGSEVEKVHVGDFDNDDLSNDFHANVRITDSNAKSKFELGCHSTLRGR